MELAQEKKAGNLQGQKKMQKMFPKDSSKYLARD